MTKRFPPTEVGTTPPRTASEDTPNVGDGAGGPQARPARRGAPRLHLVIGPVGAGKSTFAIDLATQEAALRLTLDDWMARLFRPDRPPAGVVPWYVERAARCVDQIWVVSRAALTLGVDVVLEIGLLRREQREAFHARVLEEAPGVATVVHVLDADRDTRRARVEHRNRTRGATFSMEVAPEVFELASDLWEPPDDDEREGRDVRLLRTDGEADTRR